MKTILSKAILVLAMSSCQTTYNPYAREVKKLPKQKGTIALKSEHRPEDRQKAEGLMTSNCAPQGYNVLEEGEVVTGQQTKSNTNETNRDDSRQEVGSLFGIPVVGGQASGKESQQSSMTTQLKEWQISYECQTEKSRKK